MKTPKIFLSGFLALFLFGCGGDKNCLFICKESTPKKLPFVKEETEKVSETAPVGKDSFRPQLDILFVVDDSPSMGVHQNNLATNISKFADAIVRTKFLDYHVGVITSSAGSAWGGGGATCCGKLVGNPKYVERATPNGIQALAKNLIVGTSGDGAEKFFDPIYMALTNPNLTSWNLDFYRPQAHLAIIFITDTEDQSVSQTANSIYNFLTNLKGTVDKLFVAGAYISDSDLSTCDSQEESEITSRQGLSDFFTLTKATTFSLCDNFGEKLADIGQKIAAKSQTMYLNQIPVPGTIKVTMDGVELPNDSKKGWAYNPSNISIEFGSDIDWDSYPDGVYPQIEFEVVNLKP
ncbi:hypothetical protein K2X05_06535 [bacterium]|nr:hypothetical protein [bacterium]